MDKLQVKSWKFLIKKGLSVGRIEAIGKEVRKEIENEIKENNLKIKSGQVIVKSKVKGLSISVDAKRKIMSLDKLKHIRLSHKIKLNILDQMIETLAKLNNLNYMHEHSHDANWTIEFKNGKVIVRLIDFDELKKKSQVSIHGGNDYIYLKCAARDLFKDEITFNYNSYIYDKYTALRKEIG